MTSKRAMALDLLVALLSALALLLLGDALTLSWLGGPVWP